MDGLPAPFSLTTAFARSEPFNWKIPLLEERSTAQTAPSSKPAKGRLHLPPSHLSIASRLREGHQRQLAGHTEISPRKSFITAHLADSFVRRHFVPPSAPPLSMTDKKIRLEVDYCSVEKYEMSCQLLVKGAEPWRRAAS